MPNDVGVKVPRSCWWSFWEARNYGEPHATGSSSVVPTTVLLAYRLTTFLSTAVVFGYYVVTRDIQLQHISQWTLGGMTIAFGLAALACVVRHRWLAMNVTAFYHTFITFSLLVTPVYWLLIWPRDVAYMYRIYPHGGALLIGIVDILLCAQIEFRLVDILWVLLMAFIYIAFVFLRFALTHDIPYKFLDYRQTGIARMCAMYAAILVAGSLLSVLVVAFSRVTRLYRKLPQNDASLGS